MEALAGWPTQRKGFEMRMRSRVLSRLGWCGIASFGMLIGASTASAEAVTGILVDGLLSDWGVQDSGISSDNNVGTPLNSNWTPTQGAWISEDWVQSGGYVGPLYGGQNFDAEALYTGFDISTSTLYVALVTGFDIQGEDSLPYLPGDIFIDFGQNGSWDLAFDVSSRSDADGESLDSVSARTGVGTGWYDAPPNGGVVGLTSTPYAANGTSSSAGTASFFYNNNGPWTDSWDHNVYEFGYHVTNASWLDEILLNDGDGLGWTVHWTMSCGNDVLDLDAAPVPVPAAAPIALLGMGIVALVSRDRKSVV